ncbi:MAG: alpha/beta hydrolase [Anaerolineae bacterium]
MGHLRDLLQLQTPTGVQDIATAEAWQQRREQIGATWRGLLGEGPRSAPPLEAVVEGEHDEGAYVRYRVSYSVDEGERVPAYLLVPKSLKTPAAAVYCPHQTTKIGKDEPAGLGGSDELHYARDLALRGYIALAPDHLAASERRTPDRQDYDTAAFYRRYPDWSAVGKTIWDGQRALDYLCSLPEVDAGRIGMIGHSLGGHSTIYVAGADERVKCAVSSCGLSTFAEDRRRLEWARDRWYIYIPRLRPVFLAGQPAPVDFHELVALMAPRPFLNLTALNDECFSSTDAVTELTIRVNRVYRLLGHEECFSCYFHGNHHSFPSEARALAYAWIDRWLGG